MKLSKIFSGISIIVWMGAIVIIIKSLIDYKSGWIRISFWGVFILFMLLMIKYFIEDIIKK